ncbi:hypothetical protein tb265_18100 [Gemmatimonadetes bacterium T265]|nr:hypothetical protein tb265_18100 [Gemmatimonadetes bacterium T265]
MELTSDCQSMPLEMPVIEAALPPATNVLAAAVVAVVVADDAAVADDEPEMEMVMGGSGERRGEDGPASWGVPRTTSRAEDRVERDPRSAGRQATSEPPGDRSPSGVTLPAP